MNEQLEAKQDEKQRRELEKKREERNRNFRALGLKGLSMKKRTHSARGRAATSTAAEASPAEGAAASPARAPLFLSEEQYLERFKTIKKSFSSNAVLRKAVAEQLRVLPEFAGATTVATELWPNVLRLRARVNEQQFRADEQRGAAVKSVLQMGEAVQERCQWLR